MSDGQDLALWMMLVVGVPGAGMATLCENSKKVRIAGVAWAAVWWLPPFVMLWIKGVFG